MQRLLALFIALSFVSAPTLGQLAHAQDWGVKRDPFDPKIVARYNDELVKGDDDRWRFRRRWETPVPHDDSPAPMSTAAIAMSEATMRTDGADKTKGTL